MKKNGIKIIILIIALISPFFLYKTVLASLGCMDYGIMAYEDLTGYCKCMSGYIWGKDFLGKPYCVSGDQYCHEKYGYNSRYNSLNESCQCSYGYVMGNDSMGRTQCVSPDSICTDKLGYNARYNSLSDKCECRYGYIIDDGRCTSGNSVCYSKHGLYSNYNDLGKSCECNIGYTFDDSNQCVKKQNNVYFYLKELDTNNKEAVVKSNYDNRYYHITYGSGCFSASFKRYLKDNIVINLGTDYDLDKWDYVVLYNDNETCDVKSVEKKDSSFSLTKNDINDVILRNLNLPAVKQNNSLVIDNTNTKLEPKALIKNKKYAEVFYVNDDLCLQWIINEKVAAKNFGKVWWQKVKDYDEIPVGYKFCENLK